MNKTPGPGNYEHDINFKEKSPVWSLSKSSRDYAHGEKFNLGPGQYEHPNGYKKVIGTAPSYGFDGKSQKLKYDINEVPGPGTYERPLMKSRKSIKIAEKIKDLEGLKVPGPGVSFLLCSHMSNSSMTMTLGLKEAEDILLQKIQD